MSFVTVRNIPDATHRALKLRAVLHGPSLRGVETLPPGRHRGNLRDFKGAGVPLINPWDFAGQ